MGAVRKAKWISTIRICEKAHLGGLGIGICPTHQGGPFFANVRIVLIHFIFRAAPKFWV